jgi:hypothetical protein
MNQNQYTFADSCIHGHRFTPENTYNGFNGTRPRRECKTCKRETNAATYQLRKKYAERRKVS